MRIQQELRTQHNEALGLAQFDGFPYLVTRLVPALYHVTLLPADAPEDALLRIARRQLEANRLDTCVALDTQRAIYLRADGGTDWSDDVPRGGTVIANRLSLAVDLLDTPELRRRQRRLTAFIDRQPNADAFMFGDLTKGGFRPAVEELPSYTGRTAEGVPRGLKRCAKCRDWRGKCLDPSPRFTGLLMTVHCLCDNHNRCARCGGLLYGRRLNANYYDPDEDVIWHVPGFCCTSHRCS